MSTNSSAQTDPSGAAHDLAEPCDHVPRPASALAPAAWVVPTAADGSPCYEIDASPISPAQREALQAQFDLESREVQARFAAAGVVESASLLERCDVDDPTGAAGASGPVEP